MGVLSKEDKNRIDRLRRKAKKLDYTLNMDKDHGSRRIKLTNNHTGEIDYFNLPECEEFLDSKTANT